MEATAHEVGAGDVAARVRHGPEARRDDEEDRVRDDRERHCEEPERPGAVDERGDGDERVRRVEIASEQEPRDQRAEAPPAEAPLVELIEVAAAPAGGDEAEHGDEREEREEDDGGRDVHSPRLSRVAR